MEEYQKFLKSKRISVEPCGFDVEREMLNKNAFEWQKDIVQWALKKGRSALFEDCGLGKTIQQLMWADEVFKHTNKPILIVAPLAVAEQTKSEGEKFGIEVKVCREQRDIVDGINITNYEILEHFDCSVFGGVVLDESSILKSFTSKTKQLIIEKFAKTQYKLSCTATPSPNDYMELGNQAEFLGIMSRSEMLATFFTHDGGEVSKWRLKGHAKHRFWEWLANWAVVLTNPSDLGYDNADYKLPPMQIFEHTVKSEQHESNGQLLLGYIAKTLSERRDARKESLISRCEKTAELIASNPDEQWLIWCDLNAEADMLKKIISGAVEVRGSDKPEYKTEMLKGFSDGKVKYLITKPSIAGFGLNWQCCHNMIFVGLSDSYEMMYQAIRRCYRFGQEKAVNVHIVISEAEGAVKSNIERKERQAEEMQKQMVKYTKDLLTAEIRGTQREVIEYNPQIEMIIPKWLKGA